MTSDLFSVEQRARDIFRSSSSTNLDELTDLSAALIVANKLDDARRLLELALFDFSSDAAPATRLGVFRKLVLCTYKDPDLPVDTRLRQAEQMLSAVFGEPLLPTSEAPSPIITGLALLLNDFPKLKQDLLGVAGAVQKRRWDVYGLRSHLVRAYSYYRLGYEMGSANDQGYNAINLAFVLDVLAEQEKDEPEAGQPSRDRAVNVRRELVGLLDVTLPVSAPDDQARSADDLLRDWWVLVTLGEAWLGIGEYGRAAEWMVRASTLRASLALDEDMSKHIAPWQLESIARQIAQLARIEATRARIPSHQLEGSPPWTVVRALLGNDGKAARSFLQGKIGLALSGGGFRASIFHIGVLARLAELNVLRHVEVLSCVSGGSILGAYYYLELRKLLETRTDEEIGRQDYIDLVQRISKDFLAGVQRNIRLRMLLGWRSNAMVLTSRRSSTSDRLAVLYEQELYARIKDGGERGPRYLADLVVHPCAELTAPDGTTKRSQIESFNPRYDNWTRLNKVPALVLNATSLNTCHNWQFTASFMGEPPARSVDAEIDANHRLRRMYHWEAPTPYRRDSRIEKSQGGVRLGEAVAASACVPGLFEPLLLEDIYGQTGPLTEEYSNRLVDGGNYDNQGIASLREQDCTVLLVSDACGQTGLEVKPEGGHIGVSTRANNILMNRAREAQYQLLSTLVDSGAVRGMMYLHLKKGLKAQVVDWVFCDDPSTFMPPPPLTEYGVRSDIQRLLAAIRTDLDSFSWLEADALMLSGYMMTSQQWEKCLSEIPVDSSTAVPWSFQKVQAVMTNPDEVAGQPLGHLKKALETAASLAFKPLKLFPTLRLAAFIAASITILAIIWAVVAHWSCPIQNAGKLIAIGVFGCLGLIVVREFLLKRVLHYRNSYLQIAGALIMCGIGWLFFYPYLWFIDSRYISWGSSNPDEAPSKR